MSCKCQIPVFCLCLLFVCLIATGQKTTRTPTPIFAEVAAQVGLDFHYYNGANGQYYLPEIMGAGAALLDFDNDGDLDILVSNNGQAPQLLRNDGGNANHWLQILLIGTDSNRDAVGARVKVTAGDLVLHDQKKGGMSYQSAQDPRLHFGLGRREQVDAVEIRWPSGAITRLEKLKSNQILAVKEGAGIVERAFPAVPTK